MKYFTEQWYHAGCRRIDEYDAEYEKVQDRLPYFFREGYSLHDARVVKWKIVEPYWRCKDLIIELNTHQSYTKVSKIILRNCDIEMSADITDNWWIADEISVSGNRFQLNILFINEKNDSEEISVCFDSVEIV